MNVRPHTRNVLRIFRQATAEDVRSGRAWYASARNVATELDPSDPVRAAAVLAVLSPATPWSRNVQLARQAYAMARDGATFDEMTSGPDRLPTMGASARKAAAIVLGADPASVVSGPKVTVFWQRIADAGNATGMGSVVVDRHAFDIAVGRVTDDATRGAFLGRKGGNAIVQTCYLRAARIASKEFGATITPAELQAITWTTWRREHAHAQGRAEARRDAALSSLAA